METSMTWHLNEDISYCWLDGRLFFLDIHRDAYFQLPDALERNFLDYLETPYAADIGGLIRHNLLSQSTTKARGSSTASDIEPPSQSVPETHGVDGDIPTGIIRDVFVIVAKTRRQLKKQRLKSILQALSEYRRTRTSPAAIGAAEIQRSVAEAANAFNRVRPYVPIETRCLIDSLSMVRFLAKRGLHSNLVMGVACDPFSAHAWAQHGSLVLNDSVGHVQAYAPIRVI
jgi:hypothetical protein